MKKQYTFLETISKVADVVAKVRLMQQLTEKEERIFCIQVNGMTEEMAERFMKDKIRNPEET